MSCCEELYRLKAFGILNNIYLMGGATSVNKNPQYFKECLQVVSGKIVNCWSSKDMILHTYKATTFLNPIGHGDIFEESNDDLQKIRVQNYNVTDIAGGHIQY